MSAKCRFTASVILTSLKLTPYASASFSAFDFVLFVVPKQGIVTAVMPLRSSLRRSKACTVTIKASVESSPPDKPITAFLMPVCFSLVAKPTDCIASISWQRCEMSALLLGTKGVFGKLLLSLNSFAPTEKLYFLQPVCVL